MPEILSKTNKEAAKFLKDPSPLGEIFLPGKLTPSGISPSLLAVSSVLFPRPPPPPRQKNKYFHSPVLAPTLCIPVVLAPSPSGVAFQPAAYSHIPRFYGS